MRWLLFFAQAAGGLGDQCLGVGISLRDCQSPEKVNSCSVSLFWNYVESMRAGFYSFALRLGGEIAVEHLGSHRLLAPDNSNLGPPQSLFDSLGVLWT